MDPSGFDLLRTAVLLLDEGRRVRHANTAAEERFGLSARQMQGLSAGELIRDEPSVIQIRLRALPWAWLYELPPRAAVPAGPGCCPGEVGARRESLRKLAHEIRNPLTGLRAAAQLLGAELDAPGQREYTQVIIDEADRLVELVDRLAQVQRQGLETRHFNIHEVCERVASLVSAEYGRQIEILRDYDASVPEVLADFSRILQALLNLARNAGQALLESATPDARLTIKTRIGRQLALPGRQARMGVVVSVIDNGPGVAPGLRERIFHPLVTSRAQGSGLGLSLVQEFLQAHGGTVEFDSRPGHTEFRMLLPMEPAA